MSSKTTTATTPQNENSLGSSIILFVLMMVLFGAPRKCPANGERTMRSSAAKLVSW